MRDVNRRCIDLLVHAARTSKVLPFSLVWALRDPLRHSTPADREAAAARAFLLVDMQFDQPGWWRQVLNEPEREFRNYPGSGSFPRQSGVALARATMTLAWNAVTVNPIAASILLGMDPEVAQLISSMPVTSIDGFATRHFRRVRPRWADRTETWSELLRASEPSPNANRCDLDLHALKLLLGDSFRQTHRDGASVLAPGR